MSSHDRPWFKYYPKDFNEDEKVKALSPIAELVYRRMLDVMWQANACRLPNDCQKIFNAIGKGLAPQDIQKAWDEIQYPGFEILKTTDDDRWVYSRRLYKQRQELDSISKKRSAAGKKGAKQKEKQKRSKRGSKSQANGKQLPLDTDTDSDIDSLDKSKLSSPAPSGQPSADSSQSNHYSEKVGAYLEEIEESCLVIASYPKKAGKPFNPYEAVTWATNQNGHPKAIAEVITALSDDDQWKQTTKPWAWFKAVFAQKNAKYNEADAIDKGFAFKQAEADQAGLFRQIWTEAMKRRGAA